MKWFGIIVRIIFSFFGIGFILIGVAAVFGSPLVGFTIAAIGIEVIGIASACFGTFILVSAVRGNFEI
ncbi:MAG: hypothetical protein UT66_C0013G0014 [candidate division CPR2 bacterium GW2011_GWC1_39_9]|uniref:Uncharacterized protein n=1 Tax=candidate division CPR2 bacterium GW2011_GWC2_39_10 TaxID=1618345 RepID=A0A0G0P7U6_UNCC2|nr:MAG: hypothetical protein UT18_C0012G0026 [candidate division CPR2 bacterium GW2011_GWC2_39_10]KKR35042.1 MAG: hypothetical protein UT66_C0013G0014 [candidate division CPR2 bacterium GW2011_GWC1_39_9]